MGANWHARTHTRWCTQLAGRERPNKTDGPRSRQHICKRRAHGTELLLLSRATTAPRPRYQSQWHFSQVRVPIVIASTPASLTRNELYFLIPPRKIGQQDHYYHHVVSLKLMHQFVTAKHLKQQQQEAIQSFCYRHHNHQSQPEPELNQFF